MIEMRTNFSVTSADSAWAAEPLWSSKERWLRFYSPPIIIVIIMLLQMGPKWEIHIFCSSAAATQRRLHCNRDWMRIFVIHLWNRTLEIDSWWSSSKSVSISSGLLKKQRKKKINEMGIDMLVSQMSGDLCIVSIHWLRMNSIQFRWFSNTILEGEFGKNPQIMTRRPYE